MSKIIKQDSNGVKPLLAVGEFGYDNYPEGGDIGRVYVGNGSENIPQAKKAEVVTVDGKVDTHVARIDNPHGVTKTQVGLSNVDNTADSAKVVASAGKWTTARTLSLTGGITGSVSIDGSGNASIVTTVAANSVALGTDTTGNYVAGTTAGAGVTVSGTPGEGWSPTIALTDVGTVGTYTKVTTNSKGQITVGGTLVAEDIPNLDTSKITTGTLPVDRGGTGVTTVTGTGSVVLNTSPALVTPNIGIAIGTSFNSITGLASVAPLVAGTAAVGTSTLTARQDHVHPVQTTISGNAGTATKLATARTINGVSFDGSANITVVDSTKAPLASPTFTGTPIAPTAAADTSTTQLATTAFAIPRVTGVDNAIVRFDGTTGKVQTSNIAIDDSGNLNITGTSARITGDFSNATVANRVAFQTNTLNGNTYITAYPNGTSQVSIINAYSTPDPMNSSLAQIGIVGGESFRIQSLAIGTGVYLPISFSAGGVERMRIDTNGNVLVTGAGALGYGTGSGATVTQLTSKSTSVTLNKPSGEVLTHNAALAAGASVVFIINNSMVGINDTSIAVTRNGNYDAKTTVTSNGVIYVKITNVSGSSLSDSIYINFTVLKGANS